MDGWMWMDGWMDGWRERERERFRQKVNMLNKHNIDKKQLQIIINK
jgi:hypothetical protein